MTAPMTILYADDNPGNLQLVRLALRDQNCRFLEAKDGQTAIDLALREHPDLIFMDINMPGVDGLAATKHLKALPEFARTPIIALTSNTMPGDREACFAAGCDEYLVKPILRSELLKTIAHFRDAKPKETTPAQPPDATHIAAAPEAATPPAATPAELPPTAVQPVIEAVTASPETPET
ncbi:MAG: response regulator, partial [Anaerolineae bacterium]|nr:response regulator [Anaerolineae bacterium]